VRWYSEIVAETPYFHANYPCPLPAIITSRAKLAVGACESSVAQLPWLVLGTSSAHTASVPVSSPVTEICHNCQRTRSTCWVGGEVVRTTRKCRFSTRMIAPRLQRFVAQVERKERSLVSS